MTEPIELGTVRRNRAWLANAKRVYPILEVVEGAPEDEKKEKLFWAACRLREMIDKRLLGRKPAWSLLRHAAATDGKGGFSTLPRDEIDRTISAALFKGKQGN